MNNKLHKRYITTRCPTYIEPAVEADRMRVKIMETKKIRDLVKKYLSEKPRNTVEIKDWLSNNIHLEEKYDIAAILESDSTIIRIGRVMKSGVIGKEYLSLIHI